MLHSFGRLACQTTITLTLSFVVFTCGSLLVAIQVAGVQLTPRIIATTLLRDNVVRYSVGLFVFTLVFAVMALNRLDKTVCDIVSLVTALLAIASIAMFLFLIDYAARLLRPVSILARVGEEGASVIRVVYPEPASAAPEGEMAFVPPNWEDFVSVSCTEIRACGASNVQIARRLRAMLDNLASTLPARRRAALEAERRRLDLAIASLYLLAEDRELAAVPTVRAWEGRRRARRQAALAPRELSAA
jgi:uncharacterized membrane protein